MTKHLSSRLTFFYKYVFITIWSGGFGFGTLQLFLISSPARWGFLFLLVVGTLMIWAGCGRLKVVKLQENRLYISNYLRHTIIPLSEIEEVRQNRLINIRPITIQFRIETPFGDAITFMPPGSLRLFSEDPIVAKLRSLANGEKIEAEITHGFPLSRE